MPKGLGVISNYKLYENRCGDITSGCVQLDVRWIDQSTSLPSGLEQMLLIYPYIYVDTPTWDVTETQGNKLIFKRLVAANPTGGIMSPLYLNGETWTKGRTVLSRKYSSKTV